MDQVTLETYNEILIDFIQSEKPLEKMKSSFLWSSKQGEGFIINLILFIFYTADKITYHQAHMGDKIPAKEKEYFNKLLVIENNMGECFESIGLASLYQKAVDTYAQNVNKA